MDKIITHWKDAVMLTGVVCSIIGLVYSIFANIPTLMITFALLSGVTLFAAFYMRQVALIEELRAQNLTLQSSNQTFAENNTRLEGQIGNLQQLLEQTTNLLNAKQREFEEFENQRADLRLLRDEVIPGYQKELHTLTEQAAAKQAEVGKVQGEVAALGRVRTEIAAEVEKLKAQINYLKVVLPKQ